MKINFDHNDKTIEGNSVDSLLTILKASGVAIKSSCGGCPGGSAELDALRSDRVYRATRRPGGAATRAGADRGGSESAAHRSARPSARPAESGGGS